MEFEILKKIVGMDVEKIKHHKNVGDKIIMGSSMKHIGALSKMRPTLEITELIRIMRSDMLFTIEGYVATEYLKHCDKDKPMHIKMCKIFLTCCNDQCDLSLILWSMLNAFSIMLRYEIFTKDVISMIQEMVSDADFGLNVRPFAKAVNFIEHVFIPYLELE